ncbi:hypothetical protein BG261_02905 [Floricoccus tropicus]|uniref:Uncharacterized protein n=1 Tax=Floricoccus tropicus TaxID=1859473 RepID=A0A1E8GMR9_9LACT|nr:hypothetical protein [Floricoccus tropicus]OFI49544.1 hypothetical protein BG261_02905 [Floricoccus tropicus]
MEYIKALLQVSIIVIFISCLIQLAFNHSIAAYFGLRPIKLGEVIALVFLLIFCKTVLTDITYTLPIINGGK